MTTEWTAARPGVLTTCWRGEDEGGCPHVCVSVNVHTPQTSVPPAQPHVPQPVQQCGQPTQVGDRQLVSFFIFWIDFYSLTFDRIQCWWYSRQIRSKVEFPVSAASSATNPLPDISGAYKRLSHCRISNLEEYKVLYSAGKVTILPDFSDVQ